MFGFGRVRTHLGDFFLENIQVFIYFYFFILVGFLEKWAKSCKIGQTVGVLCRGVGIPHSSIGPRQGVACPRRGVAKREDLASLEYSTT